MPKRTNWIKHEGNYTLKKLPRQYRAWSSDDVPEPTSVEEVTQSEVDNLCPVGSRPYGAPSWVDPRKAGETRSYYEAQQN